MASKNQDALLNDANSIKSRESKQVENRGLLHTYLTRVSINRSRHITFVHLCYV